MKLQLIEQLWCLRSFIALLKKNISKKDFFWRKVNATIIAAFVKFYCFVKLYFFSLPFSSNVFKWKFLCFGMSTLCTEFFQAKNQQKPIKIRQDKKMKRGVLHQRMSLKKVFSSNIISYVFFAFLLFWFDLIQFRDELIKIEANKHKLYGLGILFRRIQIQVICVLKKFWFDFGWHFLRKATTL